MVQRADSRISTVASVSDAHTALIGRLQQNRPHHIPNWHIADGLDFDDRAEHLRRLLVDVETYVRAAMQDIKSKANIYVDADVGGEIADMRGDVVGTLLNCAEDLRGYSVEAA